MCVEVFVSIVELLFIEKEGVCTLNKRIMAYGFISHSILLSVIFYSGALIDLSSQVQLATIVALSAISSGVTGVIMSLSAKKVANFEAIREYFQQGDTKEMIKNRKLVYGIEKKKGRLSKVEEAAAAEICGLFHFWGMMASKGYLPFWIFKSSSGYSIFKLFYLLESYIEDKRKINKHYAEGFEQLAKKIQKKYKYVYIPEAETVDQQVSDKNNIGGLFSYLCLSIPCVLFVGYSF